MLFFPAKHLLAQDTLFHTSKGMLNVKILEITDTEIKYKSASNPDGPVYIIGKKDVKKIVYENGTVESFQKPPNSKSLPKQKLKHQNFVYFTLTDMVFGHVTVSYEHTLLNNHLGIHIPFSYGAIEMSSKDYYEYSASAPLQGLGRYGFYNKNKIYSTGIELYYYPFEWGYANYFVGPAFGYGKVNYQTSSFIYNPTTTYSEPHTEQIAYQGWLIKNGVVFNPAKHISIALTLAMGFYTTHEVYYNGYNLNDPLFRPITERAVEAGFSVGCKF